MPDSSSRRPLKSRDLRFFRILAGTLVRWRISPNAISFMSIVFGLGAGSAFILTAYCIGAMERFWWVAAAVLIQLRLGANLLDGMVAIEGGRGGPTGELWNEAP